MAYIDALDAAYWFIARNAEEEMEGADGITNMKVQKLLYYAQGCTLALTGQPLFEDEIVAWQHGPVVVSVYEQFKDYKGNNIDDRKAVTIPKEICEILEGVYCEFGQYSAWKLRNMTHSEDPWLETKKNAIIPKEKIKKYFREHYVEE